MFPLLTNCLGEIEKKEITKTLVDTGATLYVLNHPQGDCLFPLSKASVQMVGVSNQPMPVLISEPGPCQLPNRTRFS